LLTLCVRKKATFARRRKKSGKVGYLGGRKKRNGCVRNHVCWFPTRKMERQAKGQGQAGEKTEFDKRKDATENRRGAKKGRCFHI